MEQNKQEKPREKLDMSKKPKNEVAVFGLGLIFEKLDRLIELQDRTNFLLAKIETKIEKLLNK